MNANLPKLTDLPSRSQETNLKVNNENKFNRISNQKKGNNINEKKNKRLIYQILQSEMIFRNDLPLRG